MGYSGKKRKKKRFQTLLLMHTQTYTQAHTHTRASEMRSFLPPLGLLNSYSLQCNRVAANKQQCFH